MRLIPTTLRALPIFVVAACLAALTGLYGSNTTASAQRAAPLGGFAPVAKTRGREPVNKANPWRKLQDDGHHDPYSYAVQLLQQPSEALRSLPRAQTGNFVDWVKALKSDRIKPRAEVETAGQMKRDHTDVVYRNTGTMPTVTFSHTVHTEVAGVFQLPRRIVQEEAHQHQDPHGRYLQG